MYQPEQPVFDQAIESNIEITYALKMCPSPGGNLSTLPSRLLW